MKKKQKTNKGIVIYDYLSPKRVVSEVLTLEQMQKLWESIANTSDVPDGYINDKGTYINVKK